jgi:diguanylate cyclase (GGDEF)-like protein
MSSKKEQETVHELSKLLLDIMTLATPPEVPDSYTSVESLHILHENLISLRDFLSAASMGDLSMEITHKGYMAGTLKALQANLKHLTWQTKMVASGDFSQRVEFMGEFAESFNAMVIQLDQTLKTLVKKENELSQTNKELLNEIAAREKTENALRESQKALSLQATTDPLTGLFNRRHFYKLARMEIRKALRYSRPLSLIMCDIDFFKKVNDTYGHPLGDKVIKMIAETAKNELRTTDILARYGGEEFIILLTETSAANAFTLCERLRKKIEKKTVLKGKEKISVTTSFGISDHLIKSEKSGSEEDKKIITKLITGADQALYESKEAGRNRVTIHEPGEVS